MSKQAASSSSGSIGLTGAVFLVFLILKLTRYIDWSWWWITAPLWIMALIYTAIVVIAIIVAAKQNQ